jgi:Bacteriophage head to tail connecting protein
VDIDQIIKSYQAAKSDRTTHEQVWRECFDHTYPLRGSGLQGDVIDAQQGQNKKARLVDSTATDSARILSSSIMSGLTPANARWFQLDVGDETEQERTWLDQSADLLWQNIHMSNFDAAAFESVLDVVCAGWFALYIDEDQDNGGLSFEQWPLSGVYARSSKKIGVIDTVYRCFKLTAKQAINLFGDELSDKTKKLAEKKPDDMVEFLHCIYPRDVYVADARLAKNLPIASVHLELGEKKVVRESGYHEMPVIVPRWMMIPESSYGVGPVFDALPDIKMLNELKRMELAAADLAIAGMWIAEDDGVLNPRNVKVGARKIIVANSVDSMKPLQTGSNFQLSEVLTDQLQRTIRKILMSDQLQPQDGPAMTATEVHVRVNLIRQLLGPIYGRLQAEYLQPMIERCFGLAYRAGVFSPAPDSLADRDFHIKYISPLARAQKLEDVTAIERLHMNIAQIAQIKPEVLDLIDDDKAIRVLGNALGVPAEILRSEADVEDVRERRASQQQAMQQQEMAAQMQQTAGQEIVKKAVANA